MKFSEQWLREWVNPRINTSDLAEQLTLLGLEVDSCVPVASDFQGVVVGEVLETTQHPDADRLRVCKVNIGESEPVTIVCGGQNVRAHLKVPVATVGATLAPDFKIKKAKLRGVESNGMICSESELGLTETSSGIIELPPNAPIGQDVRTYLQLNDYIIDVDLTPNRGDCLSLLGIAREIAARNNIPLSNTEVLQTRVVPIIEDSFPIAVEEPTKCPRYIGRIINNISTVAESPLWLTEKLRRSGIRSIHPIVDVTNYVMLELGQPLHAFDLDKLKGEIRVRVARTGEKVDLLDDQHIELDDQALVISDQQGIQAIAGIKGASASAVSTETQNIFLESAFFASPTIAKTMRQYGLYTDSAYRFERGVDPHLPQVAIERATQLILEILGGEAGPNVEISSSDDLPQRPIIELRHNRIKRILGITLDSDTVVNILRRLNMSIETTQHGWLVKPPSYRFDLKSEIDLIEEIARLHGYENISSEPMIEKLTTRIDSETNTNLHRIRSLFVDSGYLEAITYSFVDPKIQTLLGGNADNLTLVNPISSELSIMRVNHWPGLVQAVIYNQARQQERVRLFEIGLCFAEEQSNLKQTLHLGAVLAGTIYPSQWGIPKRNVDFFDMKCDIENLLKLTNQQQYQFIPGGHSALHPGKSATLNVKGQPVGYFGCLHPEILQKLDISTEVYLLDINLETILASSLPMYTSFSKFPFIKRDLAFIVNSEIAVDEILKKILDSADHLLKNVNVFDVYQGKGIEQGKKSIALGLVFQDDSRTLVDTEVNDNIQRLIDVLQSEFNATLRD